MSTRAWFGIKTSVGVLGTYHHTDGYPGGFGKRLYEYLQLGHIPTILDLLVIGDGWSNLLHWDGDPDNLIGYDQYQNTVLLPYYDTHDTRLLDVNFGVYYDGNRGNPCASASILHTDNFCDFPYVYAIDPTRKLMHIYSNNRRVTLKLFSNIAIVWEKIDND